MVQRYETQKIVRIAFEKAYEPRLLSSGSRCFKDLVPAGKAESLLMLNQPKGWG
jgi:hypothetical protein